MLRKLYTQRKPSLTKGGKNNPRHITIIINKLEFDFIKFFKNKLIKKEDNIIQGYIINKSLAQTYSLIKGI